MQSGIELEFACPCRPKNAAGHTTAGITQGCITPDQVVTRITEDEIVAFVPGHLVFAAAGLYKVVSGASIDGVVSGAGVDHIIALAYIGAEIVPAMQVGILCPYHAAVGLLFGFHG